MRGISFRFGCFSKAEIVKIASNAAIHKKPKKIDYKDPIYTKDFWRHHPKRNTKIDFKNMYKNDNILANIYLYGKICGDKKHRF